MDVVFHVWKVTTVQKCLKRAFFLIACKEVQVYKFIVLLMFILYNMKEKQMEKGGGASGEAYIVNIKSPTYERAAYLSCSISSPLCSLHSFSNDYDGCFHPPYTVCSLG